MFSESPPVVGYGREALPHMHQISEVVQPQHAVSSDEEQQQSEQQEAQDEKDSGGLISARIPTLAVTALRLRLRAHSTDTCAA